MHTQTLPALRPGAREEKMLVGPPFKAVIITEGAPVDETVCVRPSSPWQPHSGMLEGSTLESENKKF